MDYNEVRKAERKYKKSSKSTIIIVIILAIISIILGGILLYLNTDNANSETAAPAPTITPKATVTSTKTPAQPTVSPTAEPTAVPISRRGSAEPIPNDIRKFMTGKSYKENSTISLDDLSYLTIPHYDFNYNVAEGHLVVNKALAEEVLDIFAKLYDAKYPIERMELVDNYDADDYKSIEYNNTSAFNYRMSTSGNGLSRHALGRAIDINPQINPYVNSNGKGAHSNAAEYWSRDISTWTSSIAKAAYIGPGTEIYDIFVNQYGWTWGGSWTSYRDYQHFEKK